MLSAKDPAEVVIVTFDFSAEAASVSNPVISITWASGVADSAPALSKSGVASISGAQVMQKVTGGIAGANYLLRCEVDSSAGEHLAVADTLPVRAL